MTARSAPSGYTRMQILLHWVIAALVVFQVVFGEAIKPAYRAMRRATEPAAGDLFDARIHVYVGIAVLVLALWRLGIRFQHGVPLLPPDESPVLRWIAIATHGVLYLVIFGMPVTGIAAWFFGLGSLGEVHELGKPVIIVFATLHAAAALWQHFVAKTDVLVRMLKPQRRIS